MRKVAAFSLVLCLLAALFIAGCGSSGSSKSPSGTTDKTSASSSSAQKILEESNKKMAEVTSVKAIGTYKGSVVGSSSPSGNDTFDFAFTMTVDMSNKNSPKGQMSMKGMGEDLTMYFQNGFAYVNVPNTGWQKTPFSESGIAGATPSEMAQFTKGAQNMRIESQAADAYKIAFDIGPKFIQEQLKNSAGSTSGLTPDMKSMMDEMAKNMKMSAVFTITKSDMYLKDATIKIGVEVPTLGNMTMNMALAFSEFNQPVSVNLPPEAANAPTAENPSAVPGMPSFPGLGL